MTVDAIVYNGGAYFFLKGAELVGIGLMTSYASGRKNFHIASLCTVWIMTGTTGHGF